MDKYIFLYNWNESGGFFWGIQNAIIVCAICDKYNKIPVIIYDKGYYIKNEHDPPSLKNNWIEYFYESVTPKYGVNENIEDLENRAKNLGFFNINQFPLENSNGKPYLMVGKTYDIKDDMEGGLDYSGIYKKYFKILPNIQKYIDDFYNENMKKYHMIGIHYRGTDKGLFDPSQENDPIHYDYDWCIDLIKKYIEDNRLINYKIFAASDEHPFVNLIETIFPDKIVKIDAIRADINTANFDLKKCDNNNFSDECLDLEKQSVHKGHSEHSNFKKGIDVLIEASLLAKCQYFFKSRGNVSWFVTVMNPNIPNRDMNDGYTIEKFTVDYNRTPPGLITIVVFLSLFIILLFIYGIYLLWKK